MTLPRDRSPSAPHASSFIPHTLPSRRARRLGAASERTGSVPTGKLDVECCRHHRHRECEYPTAFLEMAAHRQFGVAEGDVRVDLAVDHEPGDRKDVKWSFPLNECIPRRHVRRLHHVKVVTIERTNTGQDGGISDPLLLHRGP